MTNGDDQQTCCIIGGCCGGAAEVTELAEWFETHAGLTAHDAARAAKAIKGPHGFDLAPTGTIKPLIVWVAEQVRLHPEYHE
jgi:hypothetical protein